MKRLCTALAMPLVFALAGGCARPVSDPATLAAIRSEARSLMVRYPAGSSTKEAQVPLDRLPPAIAASKPEAVMVRDGSVAIVVAWGFDGGWGYEVARDRRALTMPEQCYREPWPGVFWHGPC